MSTTTTPESAALTRETAFMATTTTCRNSAQPPGSEPEVPGAQNRSAGAHSSAPIAGEFVRPPRELGLRHDARYSTAWTVRASWTSTKLLLGFLITRDQAAKEELRHDSGLSSAR